MTTVNEQLRRAGEDVDDPAEAWWERRYQDPDLESARQLAGRIIRGAHTLANRVMTADERTQFDHWRSLFVGRLNVLAARSRPPVAPSAPDSPRQTVAEARAEIERLRRAAGPSRPARPAGGRRAVCWHEAGHAIAAWRRDGVRSVSLEACVPANLGDPVVLLAGGEAARLAGFPAQAGLSENDAKLLAETLRRHGTGGWLAQYRDDTQALLRDNWPAVRAVAVALERRGSLTGAEVGAIARAAMRAAPPAHLSPHLMFRPVAVA